jgi:hypothetical protein
MLKTRSFIAAFSEGSHRSASEGAIPVSASNVNVNHHIVAISTQKYQSVIRHKYITLFDTTPHQTPRI